ncbi:MAG: response regulator [Chitinophagaceae bacterium]|nr:response regulator [Oligoflexus sp.]
MAASKLKVLIVDDLIDTRDLLAYQAGTKGFEVYTAGDGLEASEIIKHKSVDIIFSDLFMPKLSGLDFLRLVRSKGSKCAFIFLTAYADKDTTIQAFSNGAYDYIQKPVREADFYRMLEQASRYASSLLVSEGKNEDSSSEFIHSSLTKSMPDSELMLSSTTEMRAIQRSFQGDFNDNAIEPGITGKPSEDLRITACEMMKTCCKSLDWLDRGKSFSWDLGHLLRVWKSVERLGEMLGQAELVRLATSMCGCVAMLRADNSLINKKKIAALRQCNEILMQSFSQNHAEKRPDFEGLHRELTRTN